MQGVLTGYELLGHGDSLLVAIAELDWENNQGNIDDKNQVLCNDMIGLIFCMNFRKPNMFSANPSIL